MTTRTKGKKVRRCNEYPLVWGAIYGCEGTTRYWHYDIGSFGREIVVGSCDTCWAARERTAGLNGAEYQDALRKAQDDAGVKDYRRARARRDKDGRPRLVTP